MEVLRQFVQNFRFKSGFGADYRVLSDVIKACASLSELTSGRALHGCVAKLGHMECNEVSKSMLNMYAKCRSMDDCKKMFMEMNSVDPVVWNILLTGLSGSSAHETMRFFKVMHSADEPKPSSVTFAIVLPVCSLWEYIQWKDYAFLYHYNRFGKRYACGECSGFHVCQMRTCFP